MAWWSTLELTVSQQSVKFKCHKMYTMSHNHCLVSNTTAVQVWVMLLVAGWRGRARETEVMNRLCSFCIPHTIVIYIRRSSSVCFVGLGLQWKWGSAHDCVCVCSIVGSVYVVNGGYRFEEDKLISLSSQSDCPSVH